MLEIRNYNKKYEKSLIDLFYKSNFNKRDEFEYVREAEWASRYFKTDSIIKIAFINEKIVASLGAVPIKYNIGNREIKAMFFSDNCILPEYEHEFSAIFDKLFYELETASRKKGFELIFGWDYIERYRKFEKTYTKNGFAARSGIDWVILGMEYNSDSPKIWRGRNKLFWKILLYGLKYYNRYVKLVNKRNTQSINIKKIESSFSLVADFLNKQKKDHNGVHYTDSYLKKLVQTIDLHIFIAEVNNEIAGLVMFNVAPWTGLMYGNPTNDYEWEKFYTITIDEFVVDNKYRHLAVPSALLKKLEECANPKWHYKIQMSSMMTDLIDIRENWKLNFYKKNGFLKPKVDNGVVIFKSLNGININDHIWSIPTRYVIAPRMI